MEERRLEGGREGGRAGMITCDDAERKSSSEPPLSAR